MSKGIMTFYFHDEGALRNWLLKAAPSGQPCKFNYFSTVQRPKSTWRRISDVSAYRRFALEHGYYGCLFGEGYHASFVFCHPRYSTLGLRDNRKRSVILPKAEVIISSVSKYATSYGSACFEEEFEFRNYHCPEAGKTSVSMVGCDLRRYIPGLYWLNYFSNKLIEERSLDLEQIASLLDGQILHMEKGAILKLYDRPEDWFAKKDRVSKALLSIPGFFSMARVERAPKPDMTRREALEYQLRVAKAWP